MKSKEKIQIVSLFAIAVLWRALMLVHYKMVDFDSAYYGAFARFFAAGHWARGLDPVWPPLYPLLVSFPMRLGLSLEAAGILVSLLASAGCVVCCYFLAKQFAGHRLGTIAALVAAFHPRLVIISQYHLTEALYVLLTGTTLALFCSGFRAFGRDGGARALPTMFLAGIALSLAFLTRPEAIIFFALLFTVMAVRAALELARRRPASFRTVLVPVVLTVGFLAPAIPYLNDVAGTEGRWSLGEKGALNFYLTYREDFKAEGIRVEPSDFAAITGWHDERKPGDYHVDELIRRKPGMILGRMLHNLPKALFDKIPSLMYWPFMMLAIAGIAYRRMVPRSNCEWLFAAWILILVVSLSSLFLMRRFFIAALPPLIVWSAIGIEELRHRIGRRAFAWSAVTAVVVFCAYTSYAMEKQSWPVLCREGGVWLKRNATSPVVIAGRKAEVSFYAESEFRPLEANSRDDLEPFLKSERIAYLVAEDYVMTRSHPQLAFLIDPEKAPAWLRPVFSASKDGHTLVIYRYE